MIEYDHVTKIFGSGPGAVTANDNVTMRVPRGEVVFLLGPSGCGKTTLLRLTNRLESISRGSIRVQGRDIQSMDPVALRQGMGYVIQQIGLFPNKSISQNIAVVPRLLGWESRRIADRVDELLGLVQLDPAVYRDRYPVELSGGQQQRVGVARALAADPEILLMDEPFGAIDPINRDQIQDEFLRLQAKLKKTVVFVSHDIHEAVKMADRIAVFKEGVLVQYDTPEAVLTGPSNKFVSDFVGADRALKVLSLLRARDSVNRAPNNLIPYDTPAAEALKILEQRRRRLGVVLQHGKPAGYVTPRLLKYEKGSAGQAAEAFPLVVKARDPLRDVLSDMLVQGMTEYCVVDDNGDFIGTITYQCIQDRILELFREDAEQEG